VTTTDATIELNGVRLAYTEMGEGNPPVLLLHGMACDRSQFNLQMQHLAPRHRAVTLDLRGHGESDKPTTPYATDVFVEDIRQVIDGLGLDRPILIGHSRGGNLALATAVAHPDLTRAVVLLDSGILSLRTRRESVGSFHTTLGGPDHAERVREFVGAQLLEPTDGDEVIESVKEVMGNTPAHVYVSMMNDGILAFDSLAAAQQCAVPGLLVLAGRSAFADPEALASLPDSWQIARVVGAGHFIQMVVPDQVNAMIDRFIELLPATA